MTSDRKEPPIPAGFDNPDDATRRLTELFVDVVQGNRIRLGQTPAERAVFRKQHGAAHGWFVVRPDAPEALRTGLFSGSRRPAWVRFSSDAAPTDPDLQTTVGIGIKLFDVPGPKLMGEGDTADLILQNHPVFFVDNAVEMVEFTYAGVVQKDYPSYLEAHPKTARILDAMAKNETSVLTTTYWSVLPFALGEGRYVKYKLEPVHPVQNVANDAPDYLAVDLANRLRAGEVRLRFLVQLQTDPARMPLDAATVEWSEAESAPIHLADLVLPRQDVTVRGQAAYGTQLAFNIWRVPPENAPQGSLAAARKLAYARSAEARRTANGEPQQEPAHARAAAPAPTEPDDCIVQAVIHPAIGVARVGNSERFFVGPEVPEPAAESPGFYRDPEGKLKRQAARFRIYGANARGEIVRELTPDDAEITWIVHLANQKAAWYQFQIALDIPEAASAPPSLLRNAAVTDRTQLVIDPGPREISGRSAHDPRHRFDTGRFMGKDVYLGEIRTDEAGRLLVLGGHGVSASFDGSKAVTFANNEGWHDDTADGPVTAEVHFLGQRLQVVPAWVIVAPPNYAPQQKSVRTMWDLMRDVAITAGTLAWPARPSFTHDILPIFRRLSDLQWVNAGFAAAFGFRGPFDLTSPAWVARLSQPDPAERATRHMLVNQFRVHATDSWSPVPWPWVYGDAMSIPAAESPRQNAVLSDTQLRLLGQWADGEFDADHAPDVPPIRHLAEVPVAAQGATLDRAAMEFCLADVFHPGCEMSWPMRTATMYQAPFRLAHARRGWIEPSYGESLTPDTFVIPDSPLGGQVPGGITRWMALPWQTDTASCRSGYDKAYDPYVPTFWPARVPNQVLSQENYQIVMDAERPSGERLAAFANRAQWMSPLGTNSYTDQINKMVHHFDHLGVVEVRPGPAGACGLFPAEVQVEDRSLLIPDTSDNSAHTRGLHAESLAPPPARRSADVDLTGIEKVRRFPNGLKR